MKKIFIISLILALTILGNAQTFKGGFMFGVSGNQIDGDEQSKYKKPGLIAGAYVISNFSERAGLKIETYYIGKGAVLNIDQGGGSVLQQFNTNLHYIEMPFLFNFLIHPKIDISLGIAPSYLFAHKLTRFRILVDESSYSLNTFDFQPMGQVGFYLTDRLSSSLRFSYSILDIRAKDPLATWYNNNIGVVIRYKMR